MATKKELEARIVALEAQIAALRAERVQPIIVQPSPAPSYPYTYPYVTYGDGGNANEVAAKLRARIVSASGFQTLS